jgi:NAD(P)-dependent dehydrogenase (short-subunit alcohol dehydrogenase family)
MPTHLNGDSLRSGGSVSDMTKNWFITGASRGFGREWTIAALERGDKVAATARDTSTMDDIVEKYGDSFVPLQLDVTDRSACFDSVQHAAEKLGRLDIVVNNAGYGHFGFVEELSEADVRGQMETNFFGLVWITQAALPIMRAQDVVDGRRGHILQVTSIGGISAFPNIGAYNASKWAVEGLTQALAAEVSEFDIAVTLIEPGGFATDWSGPSAKHSEALGAYDEARAKREEQRRQQVAAGGAGDPTASAAAVLELVDAEEPPLRCFFGINPITMAKADYASRIAEWEKWDHVSKLAQG